VVNIQQNVSLAQHSTMGLGGPAACLADVAGRNDVTAAWQWAKGQNQPVIMIGGGSNIVWRDEGYPGLVLVNKIMGYEVLQEDDAGVYLNIGGGENWDSVVERTVQAGLTGIEALSLIPGSAGATPVQNVGAYGQEISQTLVTVEAFDTSTEQFVTLQNPDCNFSYRYSRFKGGDNGRFFITGLSLRLTKGNPLPPYYGSVQAYFDENGITRVTPALLRQAVMAIRNSKLPDPAAVRNCGSFFANPVIDSAQLMQLRDSFPGIPAWPMDDDRSKIPAAWLIEQIGMKDVHDASTGMATWPRQPLVLVNEAAKSTADLLAFKQKIVDAVQAKFGIILAQEPELLP
jgi:UDP-N-acetylmuramate dehydrogenase